jgi:hypothetical protein
MFTNIDQIPFKSKPLMCVDCAELFFWTAGEQKFYFAKGLSEPKRCPTCRAVRRATIVREVGGK